MRSLRVLILGFLWACGAPPPPPEPEPAPPPVAPPPPPAPKAPVASPDGAKAPPLKPGELVGAGLTLPRLWPETGEVTLATGAKPAILFFWSSTSLLSREELLVFQDWVRREKLTERADVFAVAGTRDEGVGADDVRDIATILGVTDVPLLADPDFALANRLGVQSSPEIVAIGADGTLLAKQLRALEHGRLSVPDRPTQLTAREYLLAVVEGKTGPVMPRTMPYFPSDSLVGHLVPDATLTTFSKDGPGKGKEVTLKSLLSGKRPAAIFFFSSTCKHCQVDVPQIVQLLKDKPGSWDVIGITAIKNDQHRAVTAQYIAQQGITFPVLEDAGAYNDDLMVTSTPTTFYLKPDGTIGHVTYFQHQDLAGDWARIAEQVAATPAGTPLAGHSGWAFPLTAKDEKGAPVDFASFQGKSTLVHFWATWCVPCREELPKLLARLPELEAHGRVVLVSLDKEAVALDRYRKQTQLQFSSLLAPSGGLAERMDFGRSVPRSYVLDRHGRLAQIMRGTYEWDQPDKLARVVDRMR